MPAGVRPDRGTCGEHLAPHLGGGHGTSASCTSAAVVAAVRAGGVIGFSCGPEPVTIGMRATAKVRNTKDYYLWEACSAGAPTAASSCPTPAPVNLTPAQQTQQAKRTQALNAMCVKTQANPPLATEAELAPFLADMRAGDF